LSESTLKLSVNEGSATVVATVSVELAMLYTVFVAGDATNVVAESRLSAIKFAPLPNVIAD
jgi:hypothetical protein